MLIWGVSISLVSLVTVYYIGYIVGTDNQARLERINSLQKKIDFLEGELMACRQKYLSNSVSSSSKKNKTSFDFLTNLTENTKDDLKIVEGIGPKIEQLFHNAEIYTFEQLAQMSATDVKKILEKAGPRFQMHDPTTWARQADLAHNGQWDELKRWQAELNKGRII